MTIKHKIASDMMQTKPGKCGSQSDRSSPLNITEGSFCSIKLGGGGCHGSD